jgi:hypothetical protein
MGPLDTRLPHLEKVNDRRKVRKRLAGASRRLDQPALFNTKQQMFVQKGVVL